MLLVYCLISALCGSRLREKWKRGLLFLVMVFYLMPFAACKRQVCEWINDHCPGLLPGIKLEGKLDKNYAVVMVGDRRVAIGKQRYMELFLLLSAGITIAILFYQIYRYRTLKRAMKTYKQQAVSEEQQQIFEQAERELSVKRKVRLRRSPDIPVPSTTGIFKAFIWLPGDTVTYSRDELGDILRHELAHIMHHDLLVYVIGMLIVAIHWFNPVSYLLLYCIRMNSERYSDEAAVAQMTDKDKLKYCETLIRTCCDQTRTSGIGLGFSAQSKKHIKRRIDLIMNKKRKNMMIAIAAGVIGSVLSTAVTFAYEAPATYGYDESVDISTIDIPSDIVAGEDCFWVDGESLIEEDEVQLYDTLFDVEELPYDDFFMDEEGRIFPVEANKERTTCQHTYASGTQTRHILNGSGGCTVNYYYAKRCTKCGNVVLGELYNSVTYKVCPH